MIFAFVAALQIASTPVHATPAADTLRVTFLGTGGGPIGRAEYAGPATLIEYGREVVVVDAGRGIVQRMLQMTRRVPPIRSVFLTHLHSDHTVGLPDLWLRGWWGEGRKQALEVRGPTGTRDMTSHIEKAWSYDVDIRSGPPEQLDRTMSRLVGIDVDTGVVFNENGLRVTAIRADHGPVLSLAYRIDAGGHSVVISGDDRQSPQIIAHSHNVDVLVHSVGTWTPEALADTGAVGKKSRAAIQLLPTVDMAVAVFNGANPRMAVLYHWPHSQSVIDQIRAAGYRGPLEGADDLMEIIITDTITVKRGGQ